MLKSPVRLSYVEIEGLCVGPHFDVVQRGKLE